MTAISASDGFHNFEHENYLKFLHRKGNSTIFFGFGASFHWIFIIWFDIKRPRQIQSLKVFWDFSQIDKRKLFMGNRMSLNEFQNWILEMFISYSWYIQIKMKSWKSENLKHMTKPVKNYKRKKLRKYEEEKWRRNIWKHRKDCETALVGKERLHLKKGFFQRKFYVKKGFIWFYPKEGFI